jgi:hypothetical protein
MTTLRHYIFGTAIVLTAAYIFNVVRWMEPEFPNMSLPAVIVGLLAIWAVLGIAGEYLKR